MYLHIFEDGSIKQTKTPPTDDDLACVRDGILDIIVIGPDGNSFLQLTGERKNGAVIVDAVHQEG